MKNPFYILFCVISMNACSVNQSVVDNTLSDINYDSLDHLEGTDILEHPEYKDSLILHCGKYNRRGVVYINNLEQFDFSTLDDAYMHCIVKSVFNNEIDSLEYLVEPILDYDISDGSYELITSYYRGEKLFVKLLNYLDKNPEWFNCDIVNDNIYGISSPGRQVGPIMPRASRITFTLKDMIRSYKGLSFRSYARKYDRNDLIEARKLKQYDDEECVSKSTKLTFNFLKQAYADGILTFKDYGEK